MSLDCMYCGQHAGHLADCQRPATRAATPEDDGQTHWDIAEVGTVCHDECAVAQLRQKRAAPPEPDAGDVAKMMKWLRSDEQQHVADMLESLAAALAESRRDAERLTWLDRDDIELNCTTRMDKPIVLIFHRKSGRLLGEGLDIRAAIDAAKDSTPEPVKP